MLLNIIHLENRKDRLSILIKEIENQHFRIRYKLWPGIKDTQPKTGISLAHKQIVNFAKSKNLPEVAIAEDDLKFTSKRSYQHFIETIPKDFDLYLGGITYGKIAPDNTVNRFAGLTLYIVQERFYETFLNLPEDKHLDQAMDHKGTYIVCNPMVVKQYDGFSDNHNKIMEYEYYLRQYNFLD